MPAPGQPAIHKAPLFVTPRKRSSCRRRKGRQGSSPTGEWSQYIGEERVGFAIRSGLEGQSSLPLALQDMNTSNLSFVPEES